MLRDDLVRMRGVSWRKVSAVEAVTEVIREAWRLIVRCSKSLVRADFKSLVGTDFR